MFNTLSHLINVISFLKPMPAAMFLVLFLAEPTFATDSKNLIATVNGEAITLAEVE